MGFTIEAKSPNSHVIHLDVPDTDWEQWVLLTADRHFDSKHCNRKLMKRHMDLAVQRDALVIDAGDFFDAMQGFYDPRKNYDELRPEYVATNYLDAIVTDAGKWFEPYADRFAVIAMGNHETNLERRMGTNLVQRLVQELNRRGGQCMAGEYSGYVLFRFRIHKTKRAAKTRGCRAEVSPRHRRRRACYSRRHKHKPHGRDVSRCRHPGIWA